MKSDTPGSSNSLLDKLKSAGRAWGSDAIVAQLSQLGLRYIALVPGSSYRGIHDSLVNFNDNGDPEILLCLHEEHAVAIAHGYAKVTERPMAAAVHANVGLMHATMAIYNAYCDRVPIIVLGATGPLDAAQRRPWIDWIHTATDQAALVRPYTKFDDQPMSVNAAIASLTRATAIASQNPRAPVYICFDVSLQEQPLTDISAIRFPTLERHIQSLSTPGAVTEDVNKVKNALKASQRPLFLFGRVDRSEKGWEERVQLAEKYGALVLTDAKQSVAFPNHHPLHATSASVMTSPEACKVIREAEMIVSFDWVDLGGTLQTAYDGVEPTAHVVHLSLDSSLHNGWSKDHFDHPATDQTISVDPNKFVSALLAVAFEESIGKRGESWKVPTLAESSNERIQHDDLGSIRMADLAEAFNANIEADDACIIRLPLGWKGEDIRATHPLAYLGLDGGAGIGSGPGMAVGAALALKDTKYLATAVLGDGDFMMGSTAIWTAVRYRIPLLLIIANNLSFYNDEVHQERVATTRSRSIRNKGVGIKIDGPAPNIGQHAASLGVTVLQEQVRKRSGLDEAIKKAVLEVKEKRSVVLIDVLVLPDGYASALGENE